MNLLTNTAKRSNLAKIAAVVGAAGLATSANAATFAFGLDAIDVAGLDVKVVALGILAIGIAIAFRGIYLGKRAVNMIG